MVTAYLRNRTTINQPKRRHHGLLDFHCAEVKTRPDFLRSSLERISQLLLASDPPNSPAHMVERTKQVQQAASMAFKDICVGGKHHLQVRPRWADGR